MRLVVQRVSSSRVDVDGKTVAEIGQGLLILLGVAQGDTATQVAWGVQKVSELRIFSDELGKFNLSLEEVGGSALVVSQFTLLGDARRGRRPSFIAAAPPEQAIPLYEAFVQGIRERGIHTACGVFGAKMDVHLVNDGPVTLVLEQSVQI
ncbi:MAG: D-tyrosyl-tRNA(Tyr) deacylase [bacterium]|nr:D-tyrosyl-tRNA(Tyr) deacylase [bacterium]